ncbi:MAG: hypothetical protein JSS89_06870 [Bacteroidetes bacterium]|nr:hypothetical protein [Bacteroidota bacterium]
MKTLIVLIVLVALHSFERMMPSVYAQSTQSFNTLRLEDPSSIGSFVTVNPPSGISPYTLTLPPSLSPGTWVMRFNGATGAGAWSPWYNPVGSDKQVAWFKGTDSLKGTSRFTFDDVNAQLLLSYTGAITVSDTIMKLVNTASSSASSITKNGFILASSGTLSGAGSVSTGLIIEAQGAASNAAALFTNGRVGIGTSTPNTMLDVNADVAFRELNYTAALAATNDNLAFNTGNRSAFVRIGSQSSNFKISGLAGGYNGKILMIYNASGKTMTIRHEGTGSTAANRIVNSTTDSLVFGDKGVVTLVYSAADSRWIVTATMGLRGQSPEETTKTVTNADKTLPSADNNYIQVTNNSGEITPIFQDGSYIGQILVIQNNGPQNLKILNAGNVKCDGGEASLGSRDIATFIWDGTKWVQIGFDSDN